MKCKVGDMALIIKSAAGNEGKVVTCLECLGRNPGTVQADGVLVWLADFGDNWWRVDRKLNMYIEFENGVHFIEDDHSPFILDQNLMPIGGEPEEVKENEVSASLV